MLTDLELERLFIALEIPASGRALIRDARERGPVRDIGPNTDRVRTRYISTCMDGRALTAESRTVELPAIVWRDRDSATREIWTQPFRIDLVVTAPKGGRTRLQHTPDLLILTDSEIVVEEWREENRLCKLAFERPHLYYKDEAGQWHYSAAEEFFRQRGLTYKLRSAEELPRTFIANIEFLEDYSLDTAPAVCPDVRKRLTSLLAERAVVSHHELVYDLGYNANDIFQLLLEGIGYVDLHEQLLFRTEELKIYRDQYVYRADCLLANDAHSPAPENALRLSEGARFRFDGREFEVVVCGETEAIVKSEAGEHKPLPLSLIKSLFDASSITPVPGVPVVKPEYDLDEVLIDNKRLERAVRRQAALANPETSGVPQRTLNRWRAMVEGATTIQETLLLLGGRPSRSYDSRLPDRCVELAEKAVKDHHNTPTCPTTSATYSEYAKLCLDADIKPMSQSTFYVWIKSREDVRKRQGRRKANQKVRIPLTFEYGNPVHGVLPHDVVYIDHTVANIGIKGLNVPDLGKPTFSMAVDGCTATARAIYLSFDAPSTTSVLMLLRDYARRHGRLPRTIVLDNGSEFHSAALKRFCSTFKIKIRWRRRSKPRDSSVVERMFGVTEQEVISSMEGNTISLKNPREVSPEVNPENFRTWTLPAVYGSLQHFLFELQPNRVHPRFGITPKEYEKKLTIERGNRDFLLVRYDNLLKLLTSPPAGRVHTRTIDPRKGVFVDGIYYWNEAFASAGKKSKVEVRREMWCARVVYVCYRDKWIIAQARDGGRLDGRFLHELEIARREESRVKRTLAQRDRKSPEQTSKRSALWIPEVWDERLRDQAIEAHELYKKLGMTEALPEAANPHAGRFNMGTPRRLEDSEPALRGSNLAEELNAAEVVDTATIVNDLLDEVLDHADEAVYF